jgi:hypothetical protein
MPPRAFKRMLIWLSESCHPRRQPERGPGPRAEPRGGHGAATNNAHGGRGQANRQMGAHLWCAIWPPSTAPSFSPAPFTAPSCSPAPFTTPSFSPAPRHSGSQPEHPNAEDQGWAESRPWARAPRQRRVRDARTQRGDMDELHQELPVPGPQQTAAPVLLPSHEPRGLVPRTRCVRLRSAAGVSPVPSYILARPALLHQRTANLSLQER